MSNGMLSSEFQTDQTIDEVHLLALDFFYFHVLLVNILNPYNITTTHSNTAHCLPEVRSSPRSAVDSALDF